MPILETLAPVVLGGIASAFGQSQANRTNMRLAREQMAFQRQSAREAMSFEERMSNTAWQRGMADMRAAGVNPILAFSQGGASTPSGAAMGGASADVEDSVGKGVSSAMEALALRKNLRLLDEQIARTREETKRERFEARQSGIRADFDTARYMYYFTPDGTAKKPLHDILGAEVQQAVSNSARSMSEAELAKFSVPERQAIARVFESVGGAGKGAQLLMPLLLSLIRR